MEVVTMRKTSKNSKGLSRRRFISDTAAAIAAFTIVPRHVLGGPGELPPSEKVNLATVGAGGMAANNIIACDKHANIVALCDVDDAAAAGTYNKYPDVPKYKDFRVMIDKRHKDFDAVLIACPDHIHAVATMTAIKAGKHVYTQKPLTHTIFEARKLTEAAREAKVMTQMGNQGQSGDGGRLITEWLADDAIGKVREVHCWTNRPGHLWPQGVARPTDTPPVPPTLDWNLWLGPAPERPYHNGYVPFRWRGRWDFGTGALGDMGCHILDHPYFALKLGHPISVEASYTITTGDNHEEIDRESAPVSSVVRYEFPARGEMPPVTLTWYDGGILPFFPRDLEPERKFTQSNGILFVGEGASLLANCYGKSPRIIPEAKMQAYKLPPKTLPRVPDGSDGHEADWLRSIKDGKPASSPFDKAGPLTEMVLLGNLAIRCRGQKLLWDGPNMKCSNVPEANAFLQTPYRDGWTL
jgi:predicted dehydrogenase